MGYKHTENQFSDKRLTVEEAAYLAGLFDGEGSLYLVARKGTRRRSHHFHPEMTVANTDLALIEWVRDATGNGGIWLNKKPGSNHKQGYVWLLMPTQIRHVLPQLLPYLKSKRRRAAMMLEFFDLQRQADRGPWGYAQPAVIDQVLVLYAELRALNRRGLTEAEKLEFSLGEPQERKQTCDEADCENCRYRGHDRCYQHWLQQREPVLGNCEECLKQFDAIMPHRRFCSAKCQARNAARRRAEAS